MLLAELLKEFKDFEYEIIAGSIDTDVKEIVLDSRKATEGCLFVCIRGAVADGHRFAKDVAQAGAAVIVVEDESCLESIDAQTPDQNTNRTSIQNQANTNPTIVKVPDSRYALACISAA